MVNELDAMCIGTIASTYFSMDEHWQVHWKPGQQVEYARLSVSSSPGNVIL